MWIRPTPHGVGGLKFDRQRIKKIATRPTPHGVGGLKLLVKAGYTRDQIASHPSRGGWIEIICVEIVKRKQSRPTPHGVGGLKSTYLPQKQRLWRPTPHGVGGLK